MTGAFGLLGDPNPTHFPLARLVESVPRLDVWMLARSGALVDGVATKVRCGDRGYQLASEGPDLWIDGTRIVIVWDEPMPGRHRPWFECPLCKRRCRHLYLNELACRRCSGLDYRCRHLYRSVPGIHRIAWLRRRIGVDQRPFTPLPERPLSHTRYHRIAGEIRGLEKRLLGHLRTDVNDALERRAQLRGMLSQ